MQQERSDKWQGRRGVEKEGAPKSTPLSLAMSLFGMYGILFGVCLFMAALGALRGFSECSDYIYVR